VISSIGQHLAKLEVKITLFSGHGVALQSK